MFKCFKPIFWIYSLFQGIRLHRMTIHPFPLHLDLNKMTRLTYLLALKRKKKKKHPKKICYVQNFVKFIGEQEQEAEPTSWNRGKGCGRLGVGRMQQ